MKNRPVSRLLAWKTRCVIFVLPHLLTSFTSVSHPRPTAESHFDCTHTHTHAPLGRVLTSVLQVDVSLVQRQVQGLLLLLNPMGLRWFAKLMVCVCVCVCCVCVWSTEVMSGAAVVLTALSVSSSLLRCCIMIPPPLTCLLPNRSTPQRRCPIWSFLSWLPLFPSSISISSFLSSSLCLLPLTFSLFLSLSFPHCRFLSRSFCLGVWQPVSICILSSSCSQCCSPLLLFLSSPLLTSPKPTPLHLHKHVLQASRPVNR